MNFKPDQPLQLPNLKVPHKSKNKVRSASSFISRQSKLTTNEIQNDQNITIDCIPETPETLQTASPLVLPSVKPNKMAVIRRLRFYYERKYPAFEVERYLYKGEGGLFGSAVNVTHEEEIALIEKTRKLKMLKNWDYHAAKYEHISPKINTNIKKPPLRLLPIHINEEISPINIDQTFVVNQDNLSIPVSPRDEAESKDETNESFIKPSNQLITPLLLLKPQDAISDQSPN